VLRKHAGRDPDLDRNRDWWLAMAHQHGSSGRPACREESLVASFDPSAGTMHAPMFSR
jgi:hypothetical protein